MEYQFQKTHLSCLKTAVRGEQNQEQTQEIKLSDAMPDIGRVIACWGQVILRGKEWRGDSVAVNGGVMVWVLYAPEDGTAQRTLESWIPFQMKWDLPDGTAEGYIRAEGRLRSLDGRSVSPRKIMLRAGISAWAEALEPKEISLYQPGEFPGDLALLQNTYPVTLPTLAGEKTFQMDEELNFPETAPAAEKLVYYTFCPEITEKKVVGSRAVFRGNGMLHVLYLSGEGRLQSQEFTLPFSQLGDVEGELEGEGTLDVTVGVTDLDVTLDSEGHLRLKCGMTAQYLVEDQVLLTLTEDAYSPRRTVEAEMEELNIPARLDSGRETVIVEQTVPVDAEAVVDTTFYLDFPRQRPGENGIQVELKGQYQLLYYTQDAVVQCATARWEGTHRISSGENCRIYANAQQRAFPTAVPGESTVLAQNEVGLSWKATAEGGMPMVVGLKLGELQEPDPARPSVILRRTGGMALWDLAKAAGSTVAAIREANGLESEPEHDRLLLIPVL